MQSNIQSHNQWLSVTTFLSVILKSLFGFLKALSAPICGLGSALLDLYDIYKVATTPGEKNRKTKIITSLFSFAGNVVYSVASIIGFLNPLGLAALAFSTATPAVYKESYATYASNVSINNNHDVDRVKILREENFISKCNVAFKAIKLIGNIFLFAGFFFPPLSILGTVIVGLATIIENYDKRNNYRISKACCYYAKKLWNGICECFSSSKAKAPANSAPRAPAALATAAPITRNRRSTIMMHERLAPATIPTSAVAQLDKKESEKVAVKFSNINETVRWHLHANNKPAPAHNEVMPAASSLKTVQCMKR